jgi:uncharacterized lipoprotein YmbA
MKRRLVLGGASAASLLLVACAGDPAPTTRWYELRSEPPGQQPAPRPGDGVVWEVSGDVAMPGALDRDTLMVASGTAGLQPLAGHRWAEPLRDSIPRLLVSDLARLRGEGLVWRAPAPAGVAAGRRVRVEIVTLLADAAQRKLRLQARWTLADARAGAGAPSLGAADFNVELADGSADALAAAHRVALWQLAMRMVGSGPAQNGESGK